MDNEIFISKSKIIHGNKYDYSLVNCVKTHDKIDIICHFHGMFKQTPSKHLGGQGCPKCAGNIRKNKEDFIKDAIKTHGDKYNYSIIEYYGSQKKVEIICKEHGIFEQSPIKHLIGCGCPKCSGNVRFTKEEFAEKSNIKHNNKYNYSLVEYKNAHVKVKIICKKHGIFEQSPMSHLKGNGCPNCSKNKKLTTEQFIEKSNGKHKNKYDYSLVEYKNNSTKIKIICKKHGIFEQIPFNHLRGCGCPKCDNYSEGEKIIEKILKNKNIVFITQKKFEDCKFYKKLPFDFYLPDKNICIEFDGEQHFNKFRFEKNNDKLNIRKKRDSIKNIYCQEKNIKLYRIKYNENLKQKLNDILIENKI